MGRIAYILDAMERRPSTEQVISERINQTDQRSAKMFNALLERLDKTISEMNTRLDALEGGQRAQLENLGQGIGNGLNAVAGAFNEAHARSIKELRADIANVAKKVEAETKKLHKPDRTDEVLTALSGISNKDVIDAMRDSDIHTLLAIKNIEIPQTDLTPINNKLNQLEKKMDKPAKWVFDVERDVVNDITKVVAHEQAK